MVLFLSCMCQCALHEVLWSHIGILIRLLAAESGITAGPLFVPVKGIKFIHRQYHPVFDGVGLAGLKVTVNAFLVAA